MDLVNIRDQKGANKSINCFHYTSCVFLYPIVVWL
jgi:hypothetical protein